MWISNWTPRFSRISRQLASCLLAGAFVLALASPAAAVSIAFSGTFDDSTGPETNGDPFTLLNPASPTSESYITQVVFDLSTATTLPVTFDIATSPFAVTSGGAATGFTSAVFSGGNTILTLTFTDFDPGEAFAFTVDVDDNNNNVDALRMAGSTVTATFAVDGGTDLQAVMIDTPPPGGRALNWSANGIVVVPEPATLPLIGLGLVGLVCSRRLARRDR